MSTSFVQPGDVVTLTAPTGGVVSGTPYLVGNLLVIAMANIAQTLPFEGMVVGVHTVPKATGAAWTEGQNLYWDNTNKNFTPTATANYHAGQAVAAAASGDTTGKIRLNGIGIKAAG